jgi:hypothetical protein
MATLWLIQKGDEGCGKAFEVLPVGAPPVGHTKIGCQHYLGRQGRLY